MPQEAVGGEAVAQNWCADAECHLLSTAHPPNLCPPAPGDLHSFLPCLRSQGHDGTVSAW